MQETEVIGCAELARRVGRAPQTVRRWCAKGYVTGAQKVSGRDWVIPVNDAVAALIKSKTEVGEDAER